MYSGEKLGQALSEAIIKKGVRKADVARAFGIKQPSLSDWIKSGRIGKQHIDKLIEYFSDVVPPSHFGIQNMGLINAPSSHNQGTINNVAGDQNTNTNNFFSEETMPEKAKQILGDDEAEFLTAMPILGIDDGVEFALNPAEKGVKLKDKTQRAATFIPHSDHTFAVKMADNMLSDITPSPILQNDILIVEPRIAPRNQDLVLVCLDYQTPRQRGIFARLHMDLIGNFNIKHSELPYERLPENALICGVVVEIKRRLLPNDLVLSRIDTSWNILNTLKIGA